MLELTRKTVLELLGLKAAQYDYWLPRLTSENFNSSKITLQQAFSLQVIKCLTYEYELQVKTLKGLGLAKLLDTISEPDFILHQLVQENQYLVVNFDLACMQLLAESEMSDSSQPGPIINLQREWKQFLMRIYF